MYSSTVPNSQILLRQLVNESGITSREQQLNLKRQFKRKFSHHINLMQYHRLREDRFIISQKKILQKQNTSIQKAKEFLQLRIEKANHLKNQTLRGKSRKMEDDLSKWQKIVKKNKQEELNRIKHAEALIKNWNDKLSSSSSRKSIRLVELSKNIKEKVEEKEHKVSSFRTQLEAQMMKNPQQYKKHQIEQRERYLESINKSDSRKASRVSTESIYDKKKKQQENQLEKSLIKIVNKEQRINEARHIKFYLQERKKKQRCEKQEAIRKLRQNNLNSLKNIMQERKQTLDEKYKNSRIKIKNKSSLPQINGNKAVNIAINGPGQQWRKKDILTPSASPYSPSHNKNYDRLITEKLKDVSMMMRKNRNL